MRASNLGRIRIGIAAAAGLMLLSVSARQATSADLRRVLEVAEAPPDNPLKGFVSYQGSGRGFPHSLEWNYLSVAAVMTGPDQFDWAPFERMLDDVASRGNQFIIRWYLDYPGKPPGTPAWLVESGVELREWTNTNTAPHSPKTNYTPDYEDPRLRKALRDFIAAFGARYDGDPRLAYVPLGLLGTWGEWHNHPKSEWWASKEVQDEVMDAYEAAFHRTPLLHRYPAGPDNYNKAPNHQRRLGFHDDSFCWATVHTGRRGDSWFYETLLREAGILDRWKTQPIGGEMRPEVWDTVFNDPPGTPEGQEFDPCLAVTHATWLCHQGAFRRGGLPEDVRERTLDAARRLGYTFHISAATFPETTSNSSLPVKVEVVNQGVAPLYHDWAIELAAHRGVTNDLAHTWPTDWALTTLLPDDPTRQWTADLSMNSLTPGSYRLLLRVVNPLTGGKPLRFANQAQDQDLDGWLTLGDFVVSP